MHRRLTELLRSFSTEEIMRLDQFVRSPFFNESELLERLWAFYLAYAPDFLHADFSAANAFTQLFPERTFDKKAINKYNSLLYQLAQDFLAHHLLQNEEHQRTISKLSYFDKAQLSAHFQKGLQRAQQKLDKGPLRNTNYYFQKWQLAYTSYVYQSRRDERDGDIGLQTLNTAIDTYFLIQKLQQLNQMIARQRAVKVDYELSWQTEVEAFLQQHPEFNNPAIALYNSMSLLQQNPTKRAYYESLKENLALYATCFNKTEQRECYTILENMAKRCFEPAQYPQELFELYQQQIDNELLRQADGIHHSLFRNIAGVAINLKRFDWAKNFIQAYGSHIIPYTFQEDVRILTEAEWHFYQNRPQNSLEILQMANPSDVYYKLASKSLLVRIYFRLRAFDALENSLNTFTKFVHDQQKRIAPAKVESFRYFINYLRKLYKILNAEANTYAAFQAQQPIHSSTIQKKLQQLRKRIRAESFFNGRQWILNEIEQILNPKLT